MSVFLEGAKGTATQGKDNLYESSRGVFVSDWGAILRKVSTLERHST